MENYKFGSVKLELGVSGYMDILILNTYPPRSSSLRDNGMGNTLIVLERVEWVVPSFSNFICSFPDLFEVECLLVPFFHGGWDGVHGVDPPHKLGGNSSGKEVDQNVLISDSTEGGVVLEF